MKSNIFDSFLPFVSFNSFALKQGIWKHKLSFSSQDDPKKVMSFVNPAFTPCEQGPSAIRAALAAAHKRYLAHLVDHPG